MSAAAAAATDPVAAPAPSDAAGSGEVIKTSKAQESYDELKAVLTQLGQAVGARDQALIGRLLRKANSSRAKLDIRVLERLCREFEAPGVLRQLEEVREDLVDMLGEAPDAFPEPEAEAAAESKMTDDEPEPEKPSSTAEAPAVPPEATALLNLLAVQHLSDQKFYEEAAASGAALFDYLAGFNRRTLDLISSKAFYWYSLVHERVNKLATIRERLMLAHRTACLQHNEPGQATLAVQILRSFLLDRLYDEADRFRQHVNFPFDSASQQQQARWLFYLGQLDAMQLRYADSLENIQRALRKAPHTAVGFVQSCYKTLVLVQLLTGEIPDRALFSRIPEVRESLAPFLQLTQAVRVGDVATFTKVSELQQSMLRQQEASAAAAAASSNHSSGGPAAPMLFRQPSTSSVTMSSQSSLFTSLISRLRHNVIKAGLRRISLAYNRISLRDVALLLKLLPAEAGVVYPDAASKAAADTQWFRGSGDPMAENVEFIVARSIADGVIDAVLDRERGVLVTKAAASLYNTDQPAAALGRRIEFCNSIRDQAVKAMSYPADFMRRPVGGKIGEVDDDTLDVEIDEILDADLSGGEDEDD